MRRELPFSRSKRCTLYAIAGMPPLVAAQLEEAGLGWRGWQRVAHADGPAAQRERADLELQRLARRRRPRDGRHLRAEANELLEAGPVPADYRRPLAAARPAPDRDHRKAA